MFLNFLALGQIGPRAIGERVKGELRLKYTVKDPNFDRVFIKNIFYSIFLLGGPLWKKSTE